MMYRPDEEGKRSVLLGQKEKERERHLSQAYKAVRGGEKYIKCVSIVPGTIP